MSKHKNQHFIQREYLNGFRCKDVPAQWANTPAVWVLNIQTLVARLRSTERVAARTYYYSFEDSTGQMNPLVENWFNTFEEKFPPLREAIRHNIRWANLHGEGRNLDPEYRKTIAQYLHLHLIRIPKRFDEIRSKTREFYKRMEAAGHGGFTENDVQRLSLRILVRSGNHPDLSITGNLYSKNTSIEFFPRTRTELVTSDSPVILYDETRSPGLAHETTTVFFPLDASVFLRLNGDGDQLQMVKHHDIGLADDINHLTAITAHREIYSPSRRALERLAQRLGRPIHFIEPGRPKADST